MFFLFIMLVCKMHNVLRPKFLSPSLAQAIITWVMCLLIHARLTYVQKHNWSLVFPLRLIDAVLVSKVIRELAIPGIICEQCGSIHRRRAQACNPLIVRVGCDKARHCMHMKLSQSSFEKTAFRILGPAFAESVFLPLILQPAGLSGSKSWHPRTQNMT